MNPSLPLPMSRPVIVEAPPVVSLELLPLVPLVADVPDLPLVPLVPVELLEPLELGVVPVP